ncbi:hypothetical protein AMK59_277 [Oryctes borbonicus]|uniref:THAP-type domain-containing protein n=1 Tax=Oryctes borbonicus TaxID=1629725 RepID=A0A0T6BCB1_9SCAR|nr:hypothetical protein AMK59_277 [Oryctes borbonicus]
MNVNSVNQLHPQAKRLYWEVRRLLKRQVYLKMKTSKFQERARQYRNWVKNHEHEIVNGMNKLACGFIKAQLRNYNRKKSSRRFSEDDKVFALTLFKSSPRCYKLLRGIFALPSKTILLQTLRKFPFKTGINDNVLESLKLRISKMSKYDRYSILMFDEMQLSANITYNISEDCFVGFQDVGEETHKVIANHVLVFMLRGLRSKWKQPLAYYFVYRTMSSAQLYVTIKSVIRACQNIGLNIVATVSDQGSTNRGAVSLLMSETNRLCAQKGEENKYLGYLIDNKEVVHIFDPPHLLKCLRNTFLDNNIHFLWEGVQKTASWSHVIMFYENDQGNDDIRLVPKLTDRHIYKEKINKMKVSLAAQIFSQRLSATMRKFAGCNIPGVMVLEKSAADTADFLLFIDKVFDSVNGTAVVSNKHLRCAISNKSPHISFWNNAIEVFSSMKFCNRYTNKPVPAPPTINNWILALKGLRYIWNKLEQVGFKFLSLRNINQDPLENLFGCIRAHGFRDVNPTCSNFVYLFKTSVLNNAMNAHSKFANCEEDGSTGLLDSFKCILECHDENYGHTAHFSGNIHVSPLKDNSVSEATKAYVAGYVARQLLNVVRNCDTCKKELIADEQTDLHAVIQARSYSPQALCYPSTYFSKLFGNLIHIIADTLPQIGHLKHVSVIMKTFIFENLKSTFSCTSHQLFEHMVNFTITFMCRVWAKNVNNILKGATCYGKDPDSIHDSVKKIALKYCLTHRKRK